MHITINPWDSWKYKEIWRITQMKDGAIYKTENTHTFCKTADATHFATPDTVLTNWMPQNQTNPLTIEVLTP